MRSSRINCSLFTEFSLVQENILIQNERISQIYAIQSEQNPFLWFGVLFVDCGIYLGAVLRFTIYIDDTYPECACPKLVFDPIPYHPLINPNTGELDTKNAFPDWNSKTNKLFELLLFAKRVIRHADDYITQIRDLILNSSSHKPNQTDQKDNQVIIQPPNSTSYNEAAIMATTSSGDDPVNNCPGSTDILADTLSETNQSNSEAIKKQDVDKPANDLAKSNPGNMFSWFHHTLDFIETFENDAMEFERKVEEFKQKCYEQLFDRPALCGDDANALVFTPWNVQDHEPIRDCVLAGRFTPTSLFASYHKETESVSFIPGREPDLD